LEGKFVRGELRWKSYLMYAERKKTGIHDKCFEYGKKEKGRCCTWINGRRGLDVVGSRLEELGKTKFKKPGRREGGYEARGSLDGGRVESGCWGGSKKKKS